ncbi:MAG TPA: histidine kinase dimerization/phospho-acceptor domain-containing protein [Candidatus Sumerlaeota bacterium]|nr:histidine kinase dimerization/phospho-acceptor domain-containing protein [Candidatus Sumerlaeota bacterium]
MASSFLLSLSSARAATDRAARPAHPHRLRLIVTVPSVLILFTLGYGLVSYQTFSSHWEVLESLGAGEVAATLLRVHLTAMLVLSLLAGLIGIALTDMILRPLRSLMETARRVGEGQLDATAPSLPGASEFAELSQSFNRMLQDVNESIARRNRCLVDTIPIGVLTTNLEGVVTTINPAGARLLALAPEQVRGRRLADLAQAVPPDARELIERFQTILEGPEPTFQGSLELPADGPAGVRRMTVASSSLRDADGSPWGLLFSFRDAGAVETLSAHLSHTDHLAALGTLALGLAHELRNPLAAVKGLSQLLQSERDLPDSTRKYLERMTREVDRVDLFVKRLLELGERSAQGPTACDLGRLLTEADRRARAEAREAAAHVARDLELQPLPPLMVERDRLEQALFQILLNAYQCTPPGGRIRATTSAGFDDGGRLRFRIAVHNTGSTIAPADRRRVFEPFFTTRDQATGLGLTYAHQIVSQNGGELTLEVEEDGVRFILQFGEERRAISSETETASNPREGEQP